MGCGVFGCGVQVGVPELSDPSVLDVPDVDHLADVVADGASEERNAVAVVVGRDAVYDEATLPAADLGDLPEVLPGRDLPVVFAGQGMLPRDVHDAVFRHGAVDRRDVHGGVGLVLLTQYGFRLGPHLRVLPS